MQRIRDCFVLIVGSTSTICLLIEVCKSVLENCAASCASLSQYVPQI